MTVFKSEKKIKTFTKINLNINIYVLNASNKKRSLNKIRHLSRLVENPK